MIARRLKIGLFLLQPDIVFYFMEKLQAHQPERVTRTVRTMSDRSLLIQDTRRTLADLEAEYNSLMSRAQQIETTMRLLSHLDRENHQLLTHISRMNRSPRRTSSPYRAPPRGRDNHKRRYDEAIYDDEGEVSDQM